MTTPILAAVILLALWGSFLGSSLPPGLRRFGFARTNFRGDPVLTAYGIGILLWSVPALAFLCLISPSESAPRAYLVTVVGCGALGLLDDRWGDRRYSGIRGHFHALISDRVLTTGLIKALGGLVVAFAAAAIVSRGSLLLTCAVAIIIAMSANALNLLDLRPGRAGAVFLAAALITAALLPPAARWSMLLIAIPTACVYPRDAQARVMLGDTGSNLLGGALGLSIALAASSAWALTAWVTLLVVLHAAAERWSISEVIDRNPLLKRLDSLTGVR